jgi:hypothetical protein
MKHLALLALFTLVISMLCSVDFTLDNGAMIIGTLEGIQDNNMYIVDTTSQLHIVPMDQIKSINAGTGDVAFRWKRKKPFMNIDPSAFSLASVSDSSLSPSDPFMQGSPHNIQAQQPSPYLITNLSQVSTPLWVFTIASIGYYIYAISKMEQ